VLAHNEKANLLECLRSVALQDYPRVRTVVVDNDSRDGSPDAVRDRFPHAELIETGANLGYAEGNNVGLRRSLADGVDYVLVLNADVVVAPDAVTHLVDALQRTPQAAFAGPLVYHFTEPSVIQSAGGLRTPDWRFVHRGPNDPDEGQYRATEPVAWATGCALLARTAALRRIGLLDPAFFIYYEEVDWCLRAAAAGYQVLFVPAAKVWHKGVQRDYAPTPRVTYLFARNELLLLTKHRAGMPAVIRALARHLRTLVSWSVRPRWRSKRAHRAALAAALCDFLRRRYGPPPAAIV
jgi:GT2 family glycosyltransferase